MTQPRQIPSRRTARSLAFGLAGVIWLAYVTLRMPVLATTRGLFYVPTALTSLPFALLLGYGLSVLATLFRANQHRLRAVLRPTIGRVLGAGALMMITPVAITNWMPWILGSTALFVPFSRGIFTALLDMLSVTVPATLLWYPVSCLIVSGVKDRVWRVMLYALMFWSSYAALILAMGVQRFQL